MNCQEFWNTIPELGDCHDRQHLSDCPACAARFARHSELAAGFRALAASSRRMEAPARVETRLLKEFRRQAGADSGGRSRRWVPVLTWAAALAAMVALAVFLVRPREPEAVRPAPHRSVELAMLQPQEDADGFIPLPNSAGVTADGDEVNLVRMEVPRSAMIALGLDVSADRAEELVEADIMLGSNGIARAVRFLDE
jgi:anti-sigma factor RsiW